MKLSFSLGAKAKAGPSTNKNALGETPSLSKSKPTAFAALDDDDEDPTASSSTGFNKRLAIQTSGGSWRPGQKKALAATKEEEATISQYDEVYDDMKEGARRAKEAKESADKEKKPKYMDNLLTSAATRKLDYIRAEEKLIQREREAEGDEFAGKEKFVTQAYKDQMEAVRKAEEEEKKREELAKKNKGFTTGMSHFYRELLQRSGEEHDATVAATQTKGPTLPPSPESNNKKQPNLRIAKPAPAPAPPSDAELARQARMQGKDIELNDDNQIVDKRELLAAGLNLSAPNTRRLGIASLDLNKKNDGSGEVHRAAGTAASKREIRDRQQRELERQMREERQRLAEEKDKEEQEQRDRIVKRKNNDDDVKNARERYLERKRQKMEEDALAAAIAGTGAGS